MPLTSIPSSAKKVRDGKRWMGITSGSRGCAGTRDQIPLSGALGGIWSSCAASGKYARLIQCPGITWAHLCPHSIRGGGGTCDLKSGVPVAGSPLVGNLPLQVALLEVSSPPAAILKPTRVREHLSGFLLEKLAAETANRFKAVAAGRSCKTRF